MTPTGRQIEMIEDMPLAVVDRWYVLLALAGHKQASWVDITSDIWREGDTPIEIPEDQVHRITDTLSELGIAYKLRFRDSDAGLFQPEESSDFRRRYNQICDIFIGTSDQNVGELAEAVDRMDHQKIGLALGYPETAVGVFGTTDAVSVDGLPKELASEYGPYVYFMLSRNSFEEELATVRQWRSVVGQSEILMTELRRRK